MTEKALSDRVLARKKREAQALKANIKRRKEQSRESEPAVKRVADKDSPDV
jgi:hypothetical protein